MDVPIGAASRAKRSSPSCWNVNSPGTASRLSPARTDLPRSLVAFVRRQLERSSPALPPTLVVLGFGKDFSVLRTDFGRFRVRDRAQPTCKCCAREAVHSAITALRKTAALPCLDVIDHHSRLALFWKCFGPTGDSPMQQRTRYGTTVHSRKVVQEPDVYKSPGDCKIKRDSSLPELRS
jgi:hypothetical protein